MQYILDNIHPSLFYIGTGEIKEEPTKEDEMRLSYRLARLAVSLYHNPSMFEEMLSTHMERDEIEEIRKTIEKLGNEKGVDIEELSRKEHYTSHPVLREVTIEVWKKLQRMDLRDKYGMRNEDWKRLIENRYEMTTSSIKIPERSLYWPMGQPHIEDVIKILLKDGKPFFLELIGKAGTGKTLFARAIAEELESRSPQYKPKFSLKKALDFMCMELRSKDGKIIKGDKRDEIYHKEIVPIIRRMFPFPDVVGLPNKNVENLVDPFLLPPTWGEKIYKTVKEIKRYERVVNNLFADALVWGVAIPYLLLDAINGFLFGLSYLQLISGFNPILTSLIGITFTITSYAAYKWRTGASKSEIEQEKEDMRQTPFPLVSHPDTKIPVHFGKSMSAETLFGYTLTDKDLLPHQRFVPGFIPKGGVIIIEDHTEYTFSERNPDYGVIVEVLRDVLERRSIYLGDFGKSKGEIKTRFPVPANFYIVATGNEPIKDEMLRDRIRMRGASLETNDEVPIYPEFLREMIAAVEQYRLIVAQEEGESLLPVSIAAAYEICRRAERLAGPGRLCVEMRKVLAPLRYANRLAIMEGCDRIYPKHIREAENILRLGEYERG
jgi:predicted ATP-dependent protease